MNPVDTYIESLSPTQSAIAEQLRKLIHDIVPGVQEKFSFKIPFYHYFGMFCYINAIKDGGVDMAFCNGKSIAADFEQLEVKGRALIATVRLYTLHDIEHKDVATLLAAAAIEKETQHKKKRNTKK